MYKELFEKRKIEFINEEEIRKYAVLVPIIEDTQELYLLFERRANNLKHPHEICFPGGKLEKNETFIECAIRESVEELKITKNQIEILGPGDIFLSPFSVMIYPYLGVIHNYMDTFSEDEVESIIRVPLRFFMETEPILFKSELHNHPPKDFPFEWIPFGKEYPFSKGNYDINFYHYQDIIIWGITAHIVKSIVALIKEYKLFSV